MKGSVKGPIGDLIAVAMLMPRRKKKIAASSDAPLERAPINDLAEDLHPRRLPLVVQSVRDETASARTYRLSLARDAGRAALPFFRAGQYLSLKIDFNGSRITRPYSVSSSPKEALEEGFYEITVRRREGGFFTQHIWSAWSEGTQVEASGPCGFFYCDELRDKPDLVGLAGGCGITPFRSMLRDIADGRCKARMALLYGVRTADDIIYFEELKALEKRAPDKIRVVFVCSEPDASWQGAKGFLSADCIEEHAGDVKGKTFFICGPSAMYEFLAKELARLHLPPGRIRRELFGELPDVSIFPEYPREAIGKTFQLNVAVRGTTQTIPARAGETVHVALERARIAPPSQCRSGECGLCRSRLISGDVFISPHSDDRRQSDIADGHFHPCAAWPLSDLQLDIPAGI